MANGAANAIRSYLGRFQGPEHFASVTHTGAVTQTLVPKNMSLQRPLAFIWVNWRGRVVIGAANFTAAAAESPQTIIQRIQVQGTFKGTALTPISLTGATAFVWARLFGLRGSSAYISTGGGAPTRQAEPSVPFAQTLANFGNTGTYDLDLWYCIPTFPLISIGGRAQNIVPYLWQPADWADSLQVTLFMGDATSFGTPAAMTTTTFTSFGSAAGSPEVKIFTEYAILGPLRAGFRTACVVRNESLLNGNTTAIAQNVRVTAIQKQKTTNLLVKSGTILAGSTAGVQVFGALTDTMLERTQIQVDNRPIRNNLSNGSAKESIGMKFNTILPQGYLNFSFIDSQTARTAFRADLPSVVSSGADFGLYSDFLTAGATQALGFVQEMIFADANDPYWAGTR